MANKKTLLKIFSTSALAALMSLSFATSSKVNDVSMLKTVQKASTLSETRSSSFYTVSYENNTVKLLLDTNISSLSPSEVKQLGTDVAAVLLTAVKDDITLLQKSNNTPEPSARKISKVKYTGGTALSDGVNLNSLTSVLETIDTDAEIALFLSGSFDTLVKYYLQNFKASVETETLKLDGATVEDDIFNAVKKNASSCTSYDETVIKAYIHNNFVAPIFPESPETEPENVTIDLGDVKEMLDVIDTAENSELVENIVSDPTINIKEEIKDIISNAEPEELKDFIVEVAKGEDENDKSGVNAIVGAINAAGFTSEEITEVVNNVGVDNILDIADQIGADKLESIVKDTNVNVGEIVSNSIGELNSATILKALKKVSIDGRDLYVEGSGATSAGLKYIVSSIPTLGELASYTDSQYASLLHFDSIKIETSLGTADFALEFGLSGNLNPIRNAASRLANSIDVAKDNGTYTVTAYMPDGLKDVYEGLVSDETKKEIFNLYSKSIYDLETEDLDYYVSILEGLDYNYLYTADTLNTLFGVEYFTEAKLDAFADNFAKLVAKGKNVSYDSIKNFVSTYVDISALDNSQVSTIINKVSALLTKLDGKVDSANIESFLTTDVYNYLDKLSNYETTFNNIEDKILDATPDKFLDKTLMDLYEGNGVFTTGEVSINLSSIIPSSIYNKLDILLGDSLPDSIKVNLSVEFKDFYKVEYTLPNGEVLENNSGILPAGSDVLTYAPITEYNNYAVVGWVNENNELVTTTPANDATLTAVFDFELLASENIDGTYGALTNDTISVQAQSAADYSYTYSWTKDGVAITNTTYSLQVSDVADSGTYVVTVSNGYAEHSETFEVAIAKADYDMSGITWDYLDAFDYDATAHEVAITGTLPTGVSVKEYTDNNKTDAGTYTATVTFNYDEANYNEPTIDSVEWTINKGAALISVDTTTITKTYGQSVTLPEATSNFGSVECDTSAASLVDAGTYTVTYTVAETANYTGDTKTLTVVIEKANIDMSGVTFVDATYTYDKSEHELLITGTLPTGVSVSYTGNKGKAVGEYTATASFTLSEEVAKNYNPVEDMGAKLTITKATIDMSGVTFSDVVVTYDGQAHSLAIAGTLPADVTVSYVGNNQTEIGDYTVTAKFAVVDSEKNNYNAIEDMTAKLTILAQQTIVTPIEKFDSADGTVSIKNADGTPFPAGTKFASTKVTLTDVDLSAYESETKKATVVVVYNITLTDENGQPLTGTFTVKIKIDGTVSGEPTVAYVNGSNVATKSDTDVSNAKRDGDYMEFTAYHFSNYAIVDITDKQIDNPDNPDKPDDPTPPVDPDKPFPWWIFVIIGLLVIIIILLIVLLARRNKKSEETKVEETVVEVAPVVEETETEVTEVAPVVEETVTEVAPEVVPVVVPVVEESETEVVEEVVPVEAQYVVLTSDGEEVLVLEQASDNDILAEEEPSIEVSETDTDVTVKVAKTKASDVKAVATINETDTEITVTMFKTAKPVRRALGKTEETDEAITTTLYKKSKNVVE